MKRRKNVKREKERYLWQTWEKKRHNEGEEETKKNKDKSLWTTKVSENGVVVEEEYKRIIQVRDKGFGLVCFTAY